MIKKLFITLFLSISFYSYAQKNVLSLHKINTKRTTLLEEDSRIRIKTIQGKVYKGEFHMVDDSHIVIKRDTIAISDIYKIRPQSLFSGTLSTVFKLSGGSGVLLGVGLIFMGDYAAVLGLVLLPFSSAFGSIGYIIDGNNHKAPLWEYKVIMNLSNEKSEP